MEENGQWRRALVDALAGAIAGGISRTVTSPLDVIKIRFQVQLEPTVRLLSPGGVYGVSKYTGIFQATRDILREEGMLGLWRGNVPALLMVMPYTAIQFAVLHKFKSFVAGSSKAEDHARLSPYLSYVSGGLAGSAATVGSYPFDLLRTVLASQGEPKIDLDGGRERTKLMMRRTRRMEDDRVAMDMAVEDVKENVGNGQWKGGRELDGREEKCKRGIGGFNAAEWRRVGDEVKALTGAANRSSVEFNASRKCLQDVGCRDRFGRRQRENEVADETNEKNGGR